LAGWRRVLDVLVVRPDVADPALSPDGGRALPPGPLHVVFRNVGFVYPGTSSEVLSDVDLEIPAQTRVAVVGETGSGKTTFVKLLTRLVDPTRGEVLLGGVPLTRLRFDSVRSRVAIVLQDRILFDTIVADSGRFASTPAS